MMAKALSIIMGNQKCSKELTSRERSAIIKDVRNG
jgi:hypothetical protein